MQLGSIPVTDAVNGAANSQIVYVRVSSERRNRKLQGVACKIRRCSEHLLPLAGNLWIRNYKELRAAGCGDARSVCSHLLSIYGSGTTRNYVRDAVMLAASAPTCCLFPPESSLRREQTSSQRLDVNSGELTVVLLPRPTHSIIRTVVVVVVVVAAAAAAAAVVVAVAVAVVVYTVSGKKKSLKYFRHNFIKY